jgi:hypothetical protein
VGIRLRPERLIGMRDPYVWADYALLIAVFVVLYYLWWRIAG